MQVREVHMINVSSGAVNNEEAENDVEEGALVMYMPMPFNIVSVDSQLQQTSSSRPPIRPYSAKHNTPALSRYPLIATQHTRRDPASSSNTRSCSYVSARLPRPIRSPRRPFHHPKHMTYPLRTCE
jgi:hypothetical protein